jgi:hypothetical protein
MNIKIEKLVLKDMNLSASEADALCRHLSAALERVIGASLMENAGIPPAKNITRLALTVNHTTLSQPSQLVTTVAQQIAGQINGGGDG